jgi:Zn-dependent protease with chaperone function
MVPKPPGCSRRAMCMAAMLVSVARAASAQSDVVLERALHYFTSHDAGDIFGVFDAVRPAAVSDAERGRILAMLPADGHTRELNTAQLQKLAAVPLVLGPHRREAVYLIKVFESPQAAVALHARAVVLVSERALDLLDADELQALVAHEIGHEYFWGEYVRARREDSRSSLRTLELLCDGFAVVTLAHAGVNPGRLTSALEKIVRYNRDRFGAAQNEDSYPALAERRKFLGRLVEWLGRARAP